MNPLFHLTKPCRSQLKQHAKTHTRGRAREGIREVVKEGARAKEEEKPKAGEAGTEDENTLDELQSIDEDDKPDGKEQEEVVESNKKEEADTVVEDSETKGVLCARKNPIILHSTLC